MLWRRIFTTAPATNLLIRAYSSGAKLRNYETGEDGKKGFRCLMAGDDK